MEFFLMAITLSVIMWAFIDLLRLGNKMDEQWRDAHSSQEEEENVDTYA